MVQARVPAWYALFLMGEGALAALWLFDGALGAHGSRWAGLAFLVGQVWFGAHGRRLLNESGAMGTKGWVQALVALLAIVAVLEGVPRVVPADSALRILLVPVAAAMIAGALFLLSVNSDTLEDESHSK